MIYPVWTRGIKHIQEHKPRQDRYLTYQDDNCVILAVADGHGGSPYARSGFGARIACTVALNVLRNTYSEYQCAHSIKEHFDLLVDRHLKWKPLSVYEKEKLGSLSENYAYGTTLLAVKITPTDTTLLQIGDGRIHAIKKNGLFFPELPDDLNCIGRNTSSLVLENAADKIRIMHCSEPAECVILYTDGYEPVGDYPWSIMENLNPEYSIDNLKGELSAGDKYHDDQTLLIYIDESNYISDLFREGISNEKNAHYRKKALRKLNNDLQTLESFLSAAIVKYKKLPKHEQAIFKERSIEPRYKEYQKLKRKLELYSQT